MKRCIVNVATGPYVRGQHRLAEALPNCGRIHNCKSWLTHGATQEQRDNILITWNGELPKGSPPHSRIPYGFKAHALNAADHADYDLILWVDACIVPNGSLEPIWERIERDGYWISRNGWPNAAWTADAAYADLGITREENAGIEHVVATAFGVSPRHPLGRRLLNEYFRLANTAAFCGPWWNANSPTYGNRQGAAPCGPPEVHGHRHDQTALSVIAWRLGCQLTDPPAWFAYRGGETAETVLIADGKY